MTDKFDLAYPNQITLSDFNKSRICPRCKSGNVKLQEDDKGYFKVIECLDCKYKANIVQD